MNEPNTIKIMKKLVLVAFSVFSVLAVACFMGVDNKSIKNVVSENVEALSDGNGDGFQCIYNREEGTCRIYVGVRGKIKLFGVGVIKAGADGYVEFDGKVICHSNGDASCTPVECKDMYETLS